MDKLFPSSRRRILTGIATIALSTGGFAVVQADDAVPLRIGVLTDMSSLYADITGPGSVAAAKMAVEDFLAGPHKMKRSDRGRERRSYEQGRPWRQSRPGMDRAQQRRSHYRRANSRWRSPFAISCNRPTEGHSGLGRVFLRSDRQGLLTEPRALELRHLCAVQRHRASGGRQLAARAGTP